MSLSLPQPYLEPSHLLVPLGRGSAAGWVFVPSAGITALSVSFQASQGDFFPPGSQCPFGVVERSVLALQKAGCTMAVVCISACL